MLRRAERPATFAFYFTAGLLLGIGSSVAARIKGFWQRVPLIGMSVAFTIFGRLANLPGTEQSIQLIPYITGMVFGLVLMRVGYQWKRGKSSRPS